jgi:hypothetical protein
VGNGLWRRNSEAVRRPLAAPHNRNHSRNGRGGNRTRLVAVECGIGKRRQLKRARVALCAEEGGSKLWLKVHGRDFHRTTDTMAAASVANKNFFARLNAASKRRWCGGELTARMPPKTKTGGQRSHGRPFPAGLLRWTATLRWSRIAFCLRSEFP